MFNSCVCLFTSPFVTLARAVGVAIAEPVPAMALNTLRPSYNKEITEAALSLVTDTVKGSFLGSEVQEKSAAELSLDSAWKALGRGDIAAGIEVCSAMLATDRQNDKLFFTRAYAYARAGEWQWAMADYSAYLKIQAAAAKLLSSVKRTTSGNPTLANAYYGRALCQAKLGFHERALHDLNQCIKAGPADEQMNEANTSLVPRAKVAKLVLKQAYPEPSTPTPNRNPTPNPTANPLRSTGLPRAGRRG